MTDNLKIWNAHADIPPSHTKQITGKPYSGTSPRPQYVIYCLTEMFGPIGVGFGWTVLAEDFTPLGDEVLHWCRIQFWHTDRANTFESYGQTKALAATKNGLKLDEDAPKKSLTDAITKAASHLGVAANIFLGRWDDSKYVADLEAKERAKAAPALLPAVTAADTAGAISAADTQVALLAVWNKHPALKDDDAFKALIAARKAQLTQKETT